MLILSADMDCHVDLDGERLTTLQRDVVQEIRVTPGEHLLQAFPIGIEHGGPTWKKPVKAPDTGSVVATIELKEMVAEWEEEMANVDRFSVYDRVVSDTDTGLVWTRNVSPEMKWGDAVGYCQRLKVESVSQWRLPTLDELSKLHFPDHPSPRQETGRGDAQWTLFGKKRGEMEVMPRLIFEVFDHNSVSSIWVSGPEQRVSCSFLGEFNCSVERKKHQGAAFCVKAAPQQSAAR